MDEFRLPLRKWMLYLLGFLVFVFWLARLTTELWWFGEVGYQGIFLKLLRTRALLAVIGGALAFVAVYFNFRAARRKVDTGEHYIGQSAEDYIDKEMVEQHVDKGIFFVALFVAGVVLLSAMGKAMPYLLAVGAQPFGATDPIFGKDISFYVFQFPFVEWVVRSLGGLALFVAAGLGLLYFYQSCIFVSGRTMRIVPHARAHLAWAVAVLLALKGGAYYLARYRLLTERHALFTGASYADVNGRLPVLTISAVLLVAAGVFTVVMARRDMDVKRIGYVIAAVFTFAIAGSRLYPGFIQYVKVRPAEATLERPYMERAIAATRQAFQLDSIQVQTYDVTDNLTLERLNRHKETLASVRLWDHRPLLTTYTALQQIAPYYTFTDVDIDRYIVGGKLRQVAIGPRELYVYGNPQDSQTWVNEHVTYTHGYGVAMSPVNEKTDEGWPEFWWSGIPPKAGGAVDPAKMPMSQPGIYFGEFGRPEDPRTRSALPKSQPTQPGGPAPAVTGAIMARGAAQRPPRLDCPAFVLTGTAHPELDYTSVEGSVNTPYAGQAGIPMGSFLRRLFFAIRFKDPMILFSSELRAETRLIMYRSIMERIGAIMPAFAPDGDPYIVLGQDGRLRWIADMYTFTDKYPYSSLERLYSGSDWAVNYVRNSVKIVVDCYDGTVSFYRVDAADPIAEAYDRIFPGLMKPMSEMPEDIRQHLRYPNGLFMWQARGLYRYHMTEPDVFYSNEDKWEQAAEVFRSRVGDAGSAGAAAPGGGGREDWEKRPMEPYFVLLPLPGAEQVEFMQVMPMVRVDRPNMAAWMGAWWDQTDGKGKAVLYRFPKDYSVYGPMQIEARIDKDPDISGALTLWGSRGSQVLRGNLFAIPIEGTILWVEPIYIQATQDGIPTLQRVAVVYGGRVGSGKDDGSRVVMAPTLDEALKLALRGAAGAGAEQPPAAKPEPAQPTPPPPQTQAGGTPPQSAAAPDQAEVIRQLTKSLSSWEQRRQQEAEEMRQLREALEKLTRK